MGYQDGDPEDQLTVFELTISGERLANYPEIAELQRFGARFVPPFSMIVVVAGLWLLISAFRISRADRVNGLPGLRLLGGPGFTAGSVSITCSVPRTGGSTRLSPGSLPPFSGGC